MEIIEKQTYPIDLDVTKLSDIDYIKSYLAASTSESDWNFRARIINDAYSGKIPKDISIAIRYSGFMDEVLGKLGVNSVNGVLSSYSATKCQIDDIIRK